METAVSKGMQMFRNSQLIALSLSLSLSLCRVCSNSVALFSLVRTRRADTKYSLRNIFFPHCKYMDGFHLGSVRVSALGSLPPLPLPLLSLSLSLFSISAINSKFPWQTFKQSNSTRQPPTIRAFSIRVNFFCCLAAKQAVLSLLAIRQREKGPNSEGWPSPVPQH